MSQIYRRLGEVCWGLGILSLLAGLVFRLLELLQLTLVFSSRGGLILAGVLFLCVLATREMGRTTSPGS